MNLSELALRRESCRAYQKSATVAQEDLLDMLRTTILAPTASNRQSWRFYLCEGETAARVAECCMAVPGVNTWAPDCAAFIVISSTVRASRVKDGPPHDFPTADAGIASAYLTLAAAEKGLGTCIIGSFDEEAVKTLLHVEAERRVHLIIAVGVPAQPPKMKKDRLPFDELVKVFR